MHKLLGIALLIGGSIVGIILLWLMILYLNEGLLSVTAVIIGIIAGFGLLVMPQWVIGIYMLKAGQEDSNPG